MIHMIIFHIRDNGNVRTKLQERTIALIGLGYKIVTFTELRIRAEIRYFTANNDRRGCPSVRQSHPQHRSRRRLAMCPRYRDALVFIDKRCIDVRTVEFRDAEVFGSQDFRIIKRDSRGNDNGIGAAHILRFLAAQ